MPTPTPAPRHIALLRAINVGGRTVTMAKLKELFSELALADVETFIASGNVIFSTRARDLGALEKKIERHLHSALGYEVATFVRTPAELDAIACYRPFPETRLAAALALNVGFLARPLETGAEAALMKLRTEYDDFHLRGREVYWICTKRQNESKVNNVRVEKAIAARITFRSASTVAKLAERYAGAARARP